MTAHTYTCASPHDPIVPRRSARLVANLRGYSLLTISARTFAYVTLQQMSKKKGRQGARCKSGGVKGPVEWQAKRKARSTPMP